LDGYDRLSDVLHRELGGLSWRGRAILDAVALSKGSIGTAQQVAERLGLPNRFALARLLERQHLPPLRELADWASLLAWTEKWECSGTSLCRQALSVGRDPAVCYRIVQRLTGEPWEGVRVLGSRWILQRLLSRCRVSAPYCRRNTPHSRRPRARI